MHAREGLPTKSYPLLRCSALAIQPGVTDCQSKACCEDGPFSGEGKLQHTGHICKLPARKQRGGRSAQQDYHDSVRRPYRHDVADRKIATLYDWRERAMTRKWKKRWRRCYRCSAAILRSSLCVCNAIHSRAQSTCRHAEREDERDRQTRR